MNPRLVCESLNCSVNKIWWLITGKVNFRFLVWFGRGSFALSVDAISLFGLSAQFNLTLQSLPLILDCFFLCHPQVFVSPPTMSSEWSGVWMIRTRALWRSSAGSREAQRASSTGFWLQRQRCTRVWAITCRQLLPSSTLYPRATRYTQQRISCTQRSHLLDYTQVLLHATIQIT